MSVVGQFFRQDFLWPVAGSADCSLALIRAIHGTFLAKFIAFFSICIQATLHLFLRLQVVVK